jgi:hypothetical protein
LLIKQNKKEMTNKDTLDRVEYIVCCVGAFAMKYRLTNSQSYAYLRRFGGIDFLINCYMAEHTLSIDNAVDDLQVICSHQGGKIS